MLIIVAKQLNEKIIVKIFHLFIHTLCRTNLHRMHTLHTFSRSDNLHFLLPRKCKQPLSSFLHHPLASNEFVCLLKMYFYYIFVFCLFLHSFRLTIVSKVGAFFGERGVGEGGGVRVVRTNDTTHSSCANERKASLTESNDFSAVVSMCTCVTLHLSVSRLCTLKNYIPSICFA